MLVGDNTEHVFAGDRPFKCAVCNKDFRDERALRGHERVHHGFKETCKICNKTLHYKVRHWLSLVVNCVPVVPTGLPRLCSGCPCCWSHNTGFLSGCLYCWFAWIVFWLSLLVEPPPWIALWLSLVVDCILVVPSAGLHSGCPCWWLDSGLCSGCPCCWSHNTGLRSGCAWGG